MPSWRCSPKASPPAAAVTALIFSATASTIASRAAAEAGSPPSPAAEPFPKIRSIPLSLRPDDTPVGTVDEDFAVESLAGDVMLLGNSSWRIRRVQLGRVLVEDAQGAAPNVPFWRGEAPARTAELSAQVSWLREEIASRTAAQNGFAGREKCRGRRLHPPREWLKQECGLDDGGAEQIIKYIATGIAVLGAVPSQELIIAERFFDEGGGMQLVIHAPFGARINKAWGLALQEKVLPLVQFRAASRGDR